MKRFVQYITLSMLLALCVAPFAGCHNDRIPSDVMDEAEMVAFFKDAYTLEGFYAIETGFRYDTLYPEMKASYDSLFARHGVTAEDFERSVGWYIRHGDRYERVHKEVVAYFDSVVTL